jgi:hypothetical protein
MKTLLTSVLIRHTARLSGVPIARGLMMLATLTVGAGSLWSQIALVHVTSCGPVALPGTGCAIPATGSGNLLVVGWEIGAGSDTSTTITGITDDAGNKYAEAGAARAVDTGLGTVVDMWYAKNIAAGTTAIAVTPSTNVTDAAVVVWEFSGVDPNSPLDQTAVLNNQTGTGTLSSAPVMVTSANDVVISTAAVGGKITSITSGSGFATDSSVKGDGWAHTIAAGPGAYFAKWNQSPAGSYASCTVSFKAAALNTTEAVGSGVGAQGALNACDLNSDGAVNAADAQLAVNMSLGLTPCTANIVGPGICNNTVVNDVVGAVIGGTCPTGTTQHTVVLSWTSSNSPGVTGYNVYRGAVSGGPYNTKLDSSAVNGVTFTDSTVLTGQTYYYVATAVDALNNESGYSNETKAIVP